MKSENMPWNELTGRYSSSVLVIMLYEGKNNKPAMSVLRMNYVIDDTLDEDDPVNAEECALSDRDAEDDGFWRIREYMKNKNIPADALVHCVPIALKKEKQRETTGEQDDQDYQCTFAVENYRETEAPGISLLYDSDHDHPQRISTEYLMQCDPEDKIIGDCTARELIGHLTA